MPLEASPNSRRGAVVFGATVLAILLAASWLLTLEKEASASVGQAIEPAMQEAAAEATQGIAIDYPENNSIFPPGITPPTFLWRDSTATSWRIRLTFANQAPAIEAESKGERMKIGPIDPDCVAPVNELPKLTPQQAASWAWTPDAATWSAMQAPLDSRTGHADHHRVSRRQVVSPATHIAFTTSKDPGGRAHLLSRCARSCPAQGKDGISPAAGSSSAIHLIHWRMRDIRKPESHTVLTDVPTCLNCHSFSRDGKTMGIDLDGPNNDKGLYARHVPLRAKHHHIENHNVVQWNTDGRVGKTRVGFMSQVSPDGALRAQHLRAADAGLIRRATTSQLQGLPLPPGLLSNAAAFWSGTSKATGRRQPLAGRR